MRLDPGSLDPVLAKVYGLESLSLPPIDYHKGFAMDNSSGRGGSY